MPKDDDDDDDDDERKQLIFGIDEAVDELFKDALKVVVNPNLAGSSVVARRSSTTSTRTALSFQRFLPFFKL